LTVVLKPDSLASWTVSGMSMIHLTQSPREWLLVGLFIWMLMQVSI